MITDTLTRLEHAGSTAILPRTAIYSDKKALAIHLATLKAQGHAISADEVYENGQVSGDLRVIHFLSCVVCARGNR